MKTKPKSHAIPFYKRPRILWPVGIFLIIIVTILLWFRLSPWPGAMVIRFVFTHNDQKTSQALQKHKPSAPVHKLANQQYIPNNKDALLDVYTPSAATSSTFPVVIWTHGGAWVSGDKQDNARYFELLAAKGYTVISVDYTRGPEAQYPTAVQQLNQAHGYILKNAGKLHADTQRIFLAGDSAGSQLSSQLATIITSPSYAQKIGVRPNLAPAQLKGVILNCGIYKMDELIHPDPTLPKLVSWGTDVSVWAYAGTRDTEAPVLKQMSAYYHVTKDFPPTYITGGNGDPLTKAQSEPFASKLKLLGVDVTTLFYDDKHTPELPHEYQFNLDNQDGQDALAATELFLQRFSQ